ncbi:MAG: hypothetical protein CL930_08720 [Deltaproteobacteria bacterium]|nr:hypothetical protein [Deltaproteobacteria bacterium]
MLQSQTTSLSWVTALAVGFIGCTSPKEDVEDSESDRTDEIFERSHLLDVHIEINNDDWDVLRFQDRGDVYLNDECDWPESPFTWFSAAITIDGETFDNVGIRKKGFVGSMDEEKPSLKLKFDKFVEDQTFLDSERLTLNNSIQDESYIRQCLAYDLLTAAGTPAPRCNFAQVFLNGENLGIYVNVESMKKQLIGRHFDDNDGYLYEGTLSDFREGWDGTFEQKTNEDEPTHRPINAIATALEAPDDELVEQLEAVLDMDAFLTFWAVETMTAHWDGYAGNTNNYYLYEDPESGLTHFLPWGTDGTFVGPYMLFEDKVAPRSINAAGLLARRMYLSTEGQELYLNRLQSLLDTHWDVEAFEQSVIEMASVIGPQISEDEEDDVRDAMHETIEYIAEHGERIREEIDSGPEVWDTPLRGDFCDGFDDNQESEWGAYIPLGESSGEFSYYRIGEDGSGCEMEADLVDLESIEDCGDDCSFAMGMTLSDLRIVSGEGCTAEETGIDGRFFIFGETTSIVFEDDEYEIHGLLTYTEDQWLEVPNGYSLTFDERDWYFGQEL